MRRQVGADVGRRLHGQAGAERGGQLEQDDRVLERVARRRNHLGRGLQEALPVGVAGLLLDPAGAGQDDVGGLAERRRDDALDDQRLQRALGSAPPRSTRRRRASRPGRDRGRRARRPCPPRRRRAARRATARLRRWPALVRPSRRAPPTFGASTVGTVNLAPAGCGLALVVQVTSTACGAASPRRCCAMRAAT